MKAPTPEQLIKIEDMIKWIKASLDAKAVYISIHGVKLVGLPEEYEVVELKENGRKTKWASKDDMNIGLQISLFE